MTDLPGITPASVDVVFPSIGNATTDSPEFVVTVTLASLGLSQFDSTLSVNANAVYVLQRAEQAVWSAHSVTNSAALTTLAQQAAKDWYLWQLAKIDMSFAGIEAWTPEGTSDYVEWIHGLGTDGLPMVSTRVQRGAFYTYLENLTPPTPPGSTITVIDGVVTYVTNIIQFPTGTITQPGGPGTVVIYTPDGEHDINAWKHAGELYSSNDASVQGTFSIASNTLYGIPVITSRARTLSAIGFYLLSTGGPATHAAIALYQVQGPGAILPSIPFQQQVGIAIDAVTGDYSIAKGGSVIGLYWLVFICDGAPGIPSLENIVGVLPLLDVGGTALARQQWLTSGAFTYGGPTGIATLGFPNNPFVLATDGRNGKGPCFTWRLT